MGCDACTCGTSDRTCGGCGEPITGRHGFTSYKDGSTFSYLHAACPIPDDAA